MKTRILITTISTVLLAAFTLTAGEALLSPRAKSGQTISAPDSASGPNLATANRNRPGSPRALSNETIVTSGTDSTPALKKCAVIGSPRNSEIFGSCCKVTPAACKPGIACCPK